jgi:hypothetical protein
MTTPVEKAVDAEVYLEPVGGAQSPVRLSLEHEPEGLVERPADFFNVVKKRAAADLPMFNGFIESRSAAIRARGSVADGDGETFQVDDPRSNQVDDITLPHRTS